MLQSWRQELIGAGAVAYSFSDGNWGRIVADVTESAEYQTCKIRINYDAEVLDAYDYRTYQTFKVSKTLSDIAGTGNDSALLTHLDLPAGTPVFRTSGVEVPAGLSGMVWVRTLERVPLVFVYENGWQPVPVETVIYSGQARFIPVRSGVWQGGEAQLNTTTIRAVRFQVPFSALPSRVHSGSIITITDAPYNPNLMGRTAKVTEDFQGSTTASRTIHAMMDADSEDTNG